MKHAMSAVVALAFGFGLVAAAHANSAAQQQQSATPNMNAQQTTAAAAPAQPQHHNIRVSRQMSRRQIMHQQRMLKADGLYKGRIDGIAGPGTRMAMARLHKENASHRFAAIARHHRILAARHQNVGVGSSMPTGSSQPNDMNNTNSAPMVPPPTQAPSAGGNNNVQNDQNANH